MYRAGVSYEEFGRLNMHQIRHISNAYSEKIQEDFKMSDTIAFIHGRYMVEALLCTVGNMLGGKNNKFEYPEKPYTMNGVQEELTEEEVELQRQQFIAALRTMETNFNLNKAQEKELNQNA